MEGTQHCWGSPLAGVAGVAVAAVLPALKWRLSCWPAWMTSVESSSSRKKPRS